VYRAFILKKVCVSVSVSVSVSSPLYVGFPLLVFVIKKRFITYHQQCKTFFLCAGTFM
jgi:hypothetical protein